MNLKENTSFVAIDFETADERHDSACAIAMIRVDSDRITKRVYRLIKPPRSVFRYTYLHGISWDNVRNELTFGDVWQNEQHILNGVKMLVAHNASFDRAVLRCCTLAAGLQPPDLPFECTMRIARKVWRIQPTALPDVCRYLGLELRHHDAQSDAEACARIMIAAMEALKAHKKQRR